ncbi:helix-turn-helix transcriptional regulator [Telmatospirillum sp.]|uniref:helix-turn-helix domain-containing protein n=1 Tax=Telmatospirillum sp. TaxID=2079197 RepID=UPI002847533F|nr:helix-turn-helix transcriptional regulator [Telmatospirillum sp.]MDR3437835.1 helix-turn-helix transcriptional regulator [Telmatospirillum sp.]
MPIIDARFLREFRLKRAWSQEQLANVTGLSARTIVRLENGGRASLETIKALAAGIDVSPSSLTEPVGDAGKPVTDGLVRRITPLTVLPDIIPTLRHYQALGFSLIETEEPGCVGLRAGNTHLILITTDFMSADYDQTTVALLEGRTIPYIYVQSVGVARERFSESATVVEQVTTRAGTIEALMERDHQYLILAEKGGHGRSDQR